VCVCVCVGVGVSRSDIKRNNNLCTYN